MRLWHQSLIPYLPRQQLLGQHRECAALRGNGWGRKHSVVDYVFKYDPAYLVAYHYVVMNEMIKRGYKPDLIWKDLNYRGKTIGTQIGWTDKDLFNLIKDNNPIFSEHNDKYLKECLNNLENKGITISLDLGTA